MVSLEPGPDRATERSELRDRLAWALGTLNEVQREIVLLHDLEGVEAQRDRRPAGHAVRDCAIASSLREATPSRMPDARRHDASRGENRVKEPDAKVRLDVLDPAADDPGYWLRFQRTIVHRAGPTMADRRRRSHVTLGSVLFTWGRMILPVAAVGAGVAAVLLARTAPSDPRRRGRGSRRRARMAYGGGTPPRVFARR